MSCGKNFLRVVLDQRDGSYIRKVTEDLFQEDEIEGYRWVRNHLDRYGALPTVIEAEEAGIQLSAPRRSSSPSHYIDQLKKRYAYSKVNERHPRLVEAMRGRDTDSVITVLSEMLQEARRATGGVSYSTMADQYDSVTAEYFEAKTRVGLRGVTTGWETLDTVSNGLMGGDLVVIAGRPSMGKSWLIMQMAYAACLSGERIAFCSMEMSLKQIARRWLGMSTGINPNLIRSGEVGTYSEERMLLEIEAQRHRHPIHLMAGDMAKSVAAVEGMILEFQPTVCYIDAAYLLSPSGKKNGYISRWELITEVIRELKSMSIRHDIPVVITVQFNRNQKSKSKADLDLGDIAGSDAIPQDASIVLGARMGPIPNESSQRIVEVMKNREGDTPRFATAFSFSPVRMNEIPLLEEGDSLPEEDHESYVL